MNIALVTGAGRGLGLKICSILAKRGYRIIAMDLLKTKKLQESLEHISESLEFVLGGSDFSNPKAVRETLAEFLPNKHWTVLVNNAGLSVGGNLVDCSLAHWNLMMNVNLTAPFVLSQAFVKNSIETCSKGAIVNISSMVGIIGTKKPGYAASKAGLIGLTKSIAMQAGPSVRCNAIYPGAINTPMTADWDVKTREKIVQNTPIGRIAEPEEIAKIVAFLVNDKESGFLTGAVLNATGGQYLGQ